MRLALLTFVLSLGLLQAGCTTDDTLTMTDPTPLPETVRTTTGGETTSLTDGLWMVLPLDGHLLGWGPGGREHEASFSRDSVAWGPSLEAVPAGQPRWRPGRFDGQAIFIEHGVAASAPSSSTNHLSPELAAADSPEVFEALGTAVLVAVPGPQGTGGVMARTTAPGGGWQTPALRCPWEKDGYSWSVYVRGKAGAGLTMSVRTDGADEPVATRRVELTPDWQRGELFFKLPGPDDADKETARIWGRRKPTPPLRLSATLDAPGEFAADAMMLETHAGYARRRYATSWLPGMHKRPGETLALGSAPNPEAGTIAFNARLEGNVGWRCLLAIDYSHGWHPDMRLDVYDNQTVAITTRSRSSGRVKADIAPDRWHHYALTWQGNTAILYIDGKRVAAVEDKDIGPMVQGIFLGGVATNFSPAVRADAAFDDAAVWTRPLTAEEVAALADRKTSLSEVVDNRLAVRDLEPIDVFARDDLQRQWGVMVSNHGPEVLNHLVVSWAVDDLWRREQRVSVNLAPGTAREIKLPWPPARLLEGNYTWTCRLRKTDDAPGVAFERPLSVVRARIPAENAQVISWGGASQAMARVGTTVGGAGPAAHDVARATRLGLYSQSRLHITGSSHDPDDRFLQLDGKRGRVDQRSAAARAEVRRKARAMAARLARLRDVRYAIINCEDQWTWQPDFRPRTREIAKATFGLDLDRIFAKDVDSKAMWGWIHPGGRLSPSKSGIDKPADGIVPVDDPLLAFHRWWHSRQVGTEVYLNETITTILRDHRPDLQAIVEPTLRRPSVKPWTVPDIAQEWFYYPWPPTAIAVQERTAAQLRRRRPDVMGMPQFLFKPNMAAPYGGMPTPHLYRQATWHCLARPTRGLTYWNLWTALEKRGKNTFTQEEIDKQLGQRPTWDEARKKIKVQGEHSSVFLWIPELAEEIGRMHHEVVHPLGALWPRWTNRPRRIAMLYSFAAEIYGEVRWPYGGGLNAAMSRLQYPYDILYDNDFEEAPKCLAGYDVLMIPQGTVITRPAAMQIRAWQAGGGTVVVDDRFGADLQGVERFKSAKGENHNRLLMDKSAELLELYGRRNHPLYVEGMQQYAEELAAKLPPNEAWLDAILRDKVRHDAYSRTPEVFLNTLQHGGANYLVAVNGRRIPGPWYGHFGRVRGVGLPQSAAIDVDTALGAVAYELLTHDAVSLETRDGRHHLRLELPPAGGRVVVFLPRAIGTLGLDAPTIADGTVTLEASLSDVDGQPVPGLIPVKLEITRPDGSRDDFSHYGAFKDGRFTTRRPIALNDLPGTWQATLTDLAGNHQATITWTINTPRDQQ